MTIRSEAWRRPLALLAASLAASLCTAAAVGPPIQATVKGTDSLYDYAGKVAGDGSTTPVLIALPPGRGRVLTFESVTGKVTLTPGSGNYGPHGPRGSAPAFHMAIDPAAGLSGVKSLNVGYLAAVFLDGSEAPSRPPPPTLDFGPTGLGETFAELSPAVDQVFFVGDGHAGFAKHSAQVFNVPDGATTLVLGIVDANSYQGAPGAYSDNSGAFKVALRVSRP